MPKSTKHKKARIADFAVSLRDSLLRSFLEVWCAGELREDPGELNVGRCGRLFGELRQVYWKRGEM